VDGSYRRSAGYETPEDVANELAVLVAASLRNEASHHHLVDVCAGRGALADAFIRHLGEAKPTRVTLIDTDDEALGNSRIQTDSFMAVELRNSDVLQDSMELRDAGPLVVLCNPPFCGFRQCSRAERQTIMDLGLPTNNELAAAFVLKVIEESPPRSIFGFILRRDLMWSRGYEIFRLLLQRNCLMLAYREVGRRLMPGSGRAIGALMVLKKRCKASSTSRQFTHFLNAQLTRRTASQKSLESRGWVRLAEIASVIAGPNTGADTRFIGKKSGKQQVIRPPSSKDSAEIWGRERLSSIDWDPSKFSARRNLRFQTKPGVVYRLCSAKFVTSILPEGVYFLSATPAILPKNPRDIDLITGVSLLSSWRAYARSTIRSTNFTPSSVAALYCPAPGTALAKKLEAIGRRARLLVDNKIERQSTPPRLFSRLRDDTWRLDALIASELRIAHDPVKLVWPYVSNSK